MTVSSAGLLTARDRGTAKIIAKSGALADTTTVIVAPGPPEVTTTNTRGITSGSIWLGASVVQRGDSTKAWFEYGTGPTLAGAAATTKTLLGSSVIGNNRRISGLLPNTTYYYRALAENVVGKDTGAIQSSRTSPSGGKELLKQTGLSGITSRADFEVPAGTTRLEVSAVTATTAEGAYLYLRFGQAAEVIAADCVSQYIATAGETQLQACAIENPTAGRWHVLVVGFYSNVTLTALAHGLVEPVAVSVSPTVDTLAVGGTRQYTATVTGTSNTAVTWTSSNTTVADVSVSGLVTAKAVGQTTIRARSAADTSKSATATLQVVANPIVISLTPAVDTLAVGGTRQYTATVTGTSNTAVTWTSSNTTVADVSASGLVTAKAVGQTTIRARSAADTSKSATATLQVLTNLIAISLTPTVDTLAVSTTRQFIARVTNASDTTVTWTSSNTTVADVSASGLATAKAVGQTTIRARSVADTSKSATATLTVTTQTTSLLTLANDVPITGLSGSGGKIQFFKFTVPQGSGVFAARTLGGTGDVNMLIRRGALPNDGQYDCRSSTSPTTEEVCELTPAVVLDVQPHHGDWYISLVNGLGVPFSGVKLVATYDSTSQNAVTTLQNDQSVPGLNDTTLRSMKHHFKIAVPAGRTSLSVTVSGTGPVPDVFVEYKRLAHSTTQNFTCLADGTNKTSAGCTIQNPASGYWYISLWAFRAYTGVTLTVRYQ